MAIKMNKRKFRTRLWCAMQILMLDVEIRETGWHDPIRSYMKHPFFRGNRNYKKVKYRLFGKEA